MDESLRTLTRRRPELGACLAEVEAAYALLERGFRQGGKLLVCGNGGSAADAEHIVGELMKGFGSPRRLPEAQRRRLMEAEPEDGAYLASRLQGALPALALSSHSALLTAIANDVAFDMVFAQQVHGYGRPSDMLLAISTSGDSLDVVRALQVARAGGLVTIGLSGPGGGRMGPLCDVAIHAPGVSVSEVQEAHQSIYHCLCTMLELAFFPDGPA